MSRTRNATFAVAILALIQSGGAIAQKTDTIVGTWLLRSIQIDRDGKKVDLYGPHAAGMAIFDNGGHYISVVIDPDVPEVRVQCAAVRHCGGEQGRCAGQ